MSRTGLPISVEGVSLRLLESPDAPVLETLCRSCTDYFELIEGAPPQPAAAQELFAALPEGKEYSDKYLLGIFQTPTEKLIGIIDLIADHPAPGEWVLGLMMLDPSQRGQGLGQQVFAALATWCKGQGATSIRLGVAEDNPDAVRFWQKVGFKEINRLPDQVYGNCQHTIIVMRHSLQD